MGEFLFSLIAGTLWFTTMLPLWIYYFNKLIIKNRNVRETFNDKGKLVSREIDKLKEEDHGGTKLIMMLILGIICVCGFIVLFAG